MFYNQKIFYIAMFIGSNLLFGCSNYAPLSIDSDTSDANSTGSEFIVQNSNDGEKDKTPSASGSNPLPTPKPSTPNTGSGSNTGTGNPIPTPTPTVVIPKPIDCDEPGVQDKMNMSNAPASYGMATHVLVSTYALGTKVYSSTADISCKNKDEDGVVFPANMKYGTVNQLRVITKGAGGVLAIWIDFDGDGTFSQPNEKIYDAGVLSNSYLAITFPANTTGKSSVTTWARFRYGPGGIGFQGVANAGEVEDYQITITD